MRIEAFINQAETDGNIRGSTSERIFYIKQGLLGFYESPIFGHGFKSFASKFGHYSHNNYIELLYAGGSIVIFLYYSIYLKLFKYSRIASSSTKSLIIFSILSLLLIDIGAVTYLEKNIQYMICSLFVLSTLKNEKKIIWN